MLYYVDKNRHSRYRFVYNDEDKSVKLCDILNLRNHKLGIYDEDLPDYKRGSANWFKLKMFGFYEQNLCLCKELCYYSIGAVEFELSLSIREDYDIGFLTVYNPKVSFRKKFWNMCNSCEVNWSSIFIYLSSLAYPYILNLWSSRDFDGIMNCTANLLGTNISKLVYNFESNVVVNLVRWVK